MNGEPIMQIGEVAASTGLSLRGLQYWEELGLFEPAGRSDRGFRLYTRADVEKILFIRRMHALGFSLDELRSIMGDIEVLLDPAADPAVKDAAEFGLEATQQHAAERLEKLARDLAAANDFMQLLLGAGR